MRRDEALAILTRLKPELQEKFGVASLALFGSTARDTARPDSDVDVLVTFEGATTFRSWTGALHLIEDNLGRTVDLIPDRSLREEFRSYVEQDLIYV